jgi:hypothetical protein
MAGRPGLKTRSRQSGGRPKIKICGAISTHSLPHAPLRQAGQNERNAPPGTHDLGESLGIVLIGLVHLHLERGTGMSRVETNHIESSPAQFMHKPRRRRASFNPNTRIVFRMTPHSPLDWFRLRMALTASEPASSSVNDADRRQLLRNIQTNESGHRAPPMCEPPSDSARTAALWAVSGSRPQLPDVHTWFKCICSTLA